MQGSVQRDNHTTRCNRSQIGSHPAGMVIRKNGQPRAWWKFLLGNPPAYGLGHPAQLRIRAAFVLIAALKFQGYVAGPARGAIHKAVVERGHGSWGIYTKSARRRSAARPISLLMRDPAVAAIIL